MVRISQKASQALGTCSARYFKAVIRMNLMRDNKVATEDFALSERTFGPDIGGLNGKTTRSKLFPMKSQAICIPRELFSLYEEVEMSLDALHVDLKLLATSISHETHYMIAVTTDVIENKNLMNAVDDMCQVHYKSGFCVVKLHFDKQFEPAVDEWRIKKDPIAKVNYYNSREHVPIAELNNRTF